MSDFKEVLFESKNLINVIKNSDIGELQSIAHEIRDFIVETVQQNGGHLSSNLGTVELTLALYRVFDFPEKDMLVWDTGHQTYTHKILTERMQSFKTLRKMGGISGFTNIFESKYDSFGAGHVGTSIAAALGFEKAKKLSGEPGEVIAVIGDGALTSGNALESLNQVVGQKSNLKIIVNDNGMSISDNVGSFANNFSLIRTGKGYNTFKKQLKSFLRETHLTGLETILEWIRDNMKHNLLPDSIFESMGFKYLGPVDGHDLETLIRVLANIKDGYKKPVVLHIHTKKGCGIDYAEAKPNIFHGVSPLEKNTSPDQKKSDQLSFSDAMGYTLAKFADYDDRLIAITSAMDIGTGLHHFKASCEERFFDLGITEQSSLVFAGAMALKGFHPLYAVYSTFLQRAYDQIIHDIALQKIPLVVAVDRAGLVGNDGPTHHGTFDINMLNPIPNIKVYAPDSVSNMVRIMNFLMGKKWNVANPIFIRYPRVLEDISYEEIDKIIFNDEKKDPEQWEIIQNHQYNPKIELIIFALGTMFNQCKQMINKVNFPIRLVKVTSVKPIDTSLIQQLFNPENNITNQQKIVISIEEGMRTGGFGEHLIGFLKEKYQNQIFKTICLGIDQFITQGNRDELLHETGLSTQSIYNTLEAEIGEIIHQHTMTS
ncbi:MAG TPA: 1-deoxy-D-xylulose-5-phosphate synthase [Bacteroidales bacterium]|nr:1-deoxy-D-xylulose-5-phosphate synthase [Bacteroidales bacterium]HRW33580.1 1-deoxy-D-xylulose-5-phosphate synthase [Thermotogota bacterium]